MIIHEDILQGSQEWLAIRAGKPTCSRFDEIVTPGGELSKTSEGYMHHLLAERILGQPIDGFKSSAMQHGNDFEHKAIAAYEFTSGVTTKKIGFVTTDCGRVGCSPDSFIEEHPEGMVECKAPAEARIHVSYLRAAMGAAKAYRVQLQGELWVCEKEWVDIISHYPGIPDALFRVTRDEDFIGKMSKAVFAFADLLDSLTEDFKARGWIVPRVEPEAPEVGPLGLTDEDFEAAMRWADPA